jgi:hypothetical protein
MMPMINTSILSQKLKVQHICILEGKKPSKNLL